MQGLERELRREAEHLVHLPQQAPRLRDMTEFHFSNSTCQIEGEIVPVAELALAHGVILIGGGNTANMLAVWRVHGFDRVLREAWEAGVVLTGWSAGMICWFEAGVTDSFGPQLEGLRDGLGFLPGSACPHYDGEEQRRPVYQRLVHDGFPPGLALDDDAGAHYVGTTLKRVLATTPAATGYLVAHTGEQRLEAERI